MKNFKKVIVDSFKLYFQPFAKLWKRICTEYRFIKSVIPFSKSPILYRNRVGLAKALRLVTLKGIGEFHFTFTKEYYKKTPDEKIVEYTKAIHSFILIDHTLENGFTPLDPSKL